MIPKVGKIVIQQFGKKPLRIVKTPERYLYLFKFLIDLLFCVEQAMSVHPLLNLATRAVRSASRILFRNFDKLEDNLLTPVRRRALSQRIQNDVFKELADQIQSLYPRHELCHSHHSPNQPTVEHRWIIDAVDASESLQRGLPHFAITVAYQLDGVTTVGLVHNPIQDETFSAVIGQGALLGQKRIRTNTNVRALSSALIAGNIRTITKLATGHYLSGSDALDIAYVASGRLDGFCSTNNKPHDLSAALLIAKEAGTLTTTLKDEEASGTSSNLLVAHPKLHKQMLACLHET
jgi:myo-inositol-1(or 4)-monophosphatase